MKTAILITTFLRDDLLKKAVESMQKFAPAYKIIIGDQNPTLDKLSFYHNSGCVYEALEFDCGLSKARNMLVKIANRLGYEYVVLASDSFIFNEKTNLDLSYPVLNEFDVLGFHLTGCSVYWVGNLTLEPNKSFVLEFYDRSNKESYVSIDKLRVLPCNIIHNFFITKTNVLLNTPWDEYLVMAEHEDEFYRLNKAGYTVGWTPDISCDKITSRSGKHGEYRLKNWKLGLQRLIDKYNLKSWIKYQNLCLGKQLDIIK